MTLAERLEAARGQAAVGPVEERGILRVTGKDAVRFLHRMSTQELLKLEPGQATACAFLDARGHLVSDALLLRREDDLFLVTAPAAVSGLLPHLRRFVLRDAVAFEELSERLRCVALLGPRAQGPDTAAGAFLAGRGVALPDARRGAPALDLLLEPPDADGLVDACVRAGWAALSAADLEALRIEAGVPRFGADLEPGRLAVEAALGDGAISYEKGCFLGQEVVLRATFRGQVQRGLVQLSLPEAAGPGAPLRAGELLVGQVTSAAETSQGRLGLGYLKRAFWKPGERLSTDGGEAVVRKALVPER
jgi:folate-binding protein YgfZ